MPSLKFRILNHIPQVEWLWLVNQRPLTDSSCSSHRSSNNWDWLRLQLQLQLQLRLPLLNAVLSGSDWGFFFWAPDARWVVEKLKWILRKVFNLPLFCRSFATNRWPLQHVLFSLLRVIKIFNFFCTENKTSPSERNTIVIVKKLVFDFLEKCFLIFE